MSSWSQKNFTCQRSGCKTTYVRKFRHDFYCDYCTENYPGDLEDLLTSIRNQPKNREERKKIRKAEKEAQERELERTGRTAQEIAERNDYRRRYRESTTHHVQVTIKTRNTRKCFHGEFHNDSYKTLVFPLYCWMMEDKYYLSNDPLVDEGCYQSFIDGYGSYIYDENITISADTITKIEVVQNLSEPEWS